MQVNEGQKCLICKEEYGTTTSETGTAERQIRLPCNAKHMIGSECIVTWLEKHNTCPICRFEFFPAERTKSERLEALYVDVIDDEDMSYLGEDTDDEDFMDEGGETSYEDENMSDDEEDMSDGDS